MQDGTTESFADTIVDVTGEDRDPAWRLRSFRHGAMSDDDLAALSGPQITLVVGTVCVVLGLSVVWRGDVSETAAGFWPPAGASLVAMILLPARRWGWVFAGILLPTADRPRVLAMMPIGAGLWWGVGNCVEPALGGAGVLRLVAIVAVVDRGRLHGGLPAVAVVDRADGRRRHRERSAPSPATARVARRLARVGARRRPRRPGGRPAVHHVHDARVCPPARAARLVGLARS